MDTQNLLYIGSYICRLDDLGSVRNALMGFIDDRLNHRPSAKAMRNLRTARGMAKQGLPIIDIVDACMNAGDTPTTQAVASLASVVDLSDAKSLSMPKAQSYLFDQLLRHAGDAQAVENISALAREVRDVLASETGLKPHGYWHSWNILQRAIWCIERCNSVPETIVALSGDAAEETMRSFSTVADLWLKWSPNAGNF